MVRTCLRPPLGFSGCTYITRNTYISKSRYGRKNAVFIITIELELWGFGDRCTTSEKEGYAQLRIPPTQRITKERIRKKLYRVCCRAASMLLVWYMPLLCVLYGKINRGQPNFFPFKEKICDTRISKQDRESYPMKKGRGWLETRVLASLTRSYQHKVSAYGTAQYKGSEVVLFIWFENKLSLLPRQAFCTRQM